jgi:hypothetical protein
VNRWPEGTSIGTIFADLFAEGMAERWGSLHVFDFASDTDSAGEPWSEDLP